MAEVEAATAAAEAALDLVGPPPPDVVAEAELANADERTAEVLRICKCVLAACPIPAPSTCLPPGPLASTCSRSMWIFTVCFLIPCVHLASTVYSRLLKWAKSKVYVVSAVAALSLLTLIAHTPT